MSKKSKCVRFDNVSSEDEIVDMDNMLESQAKAGPSRLANKRVLVLNADYQPLSYKPLSTVPWTQAMFWLVKGWSRVADGGKPIITVVEEYDEVVHTGNDEFILPSVIAMAHMVPMPQKAPFTRSNIYLRDDYTCQYTGTKCKPSELTLDHIIPQSKGGKSNWTNLVACRRDVNYRKADKSVKVAGLRLIREPYIPNTWELHEKGRNYPIPFAHDSWASYVFWNVILEDN